MYLNTFCLVVAGAGFGGLVMLLAARSELKLRRKP